MNARKEMLQFLRVHGSSQSIFAADDSVADKLLKMLLEGEGSVLSRDRDLLVKMMESVLANVLPRSIAHHQ